ncbi:bactofilin family protein [Paenibacillus pinihumi]|uniref:bactofilin family protein n=1 Tax=Paenibacillus pinihumi TaxID=669462 RepID=UPI000402C7FC|nr:polymer-forming cytoskeletal protein [Paenibacillus pinihumi]
MFKDHKQRLSSMETLIGQGTKAEGKFHCETGIRIEGEYHGDIECKGDVIVGEYGVCKSSISAQDVTIAGVVYGEVHTRGVLTITASGQLHGSTTAHSLVIQEGGVLNGTCLMEKPSVSSGAPLAPNTDKPRAEQESKGKDKKALQAG